MTYEIWFGIYNTGLRVDYRDIFIDDLLQRVEHLRQYYSGNLWLKLVEKNA